MFDYRRTHTCGELTDAEIGQEVTLSGWVHRRRDHGGVIFIDLRDRFGLTQLVFRHEVSADAHEDAYRLRSEWVISIKGLVVARAEGMVNPKLATGAIEVNVTELEFLSEARTPPISVSDEQIDVSEELRLKYRFLDLRRGRVADNLRLRHRAMMATRHFFDRQGFCEICTPILGKSTPEGARDYLVPSRVHPGHFYALPQSPQIFKQLLMISGMDRYFQIAPCFRDEDLRADRQPEFTQIDVEMSFETREELFHLMEGLIEAVVAETLGLKVERPFPRMEHAQAIEKYGSDKPDVRFGMEHQIVNDIAERSEFAVFKEQLKAEGLVKGICVKGGADISRKGIDEYTTFVGRLGIKGLAWMKVTEEGLSSNIVKFFAPELQKQLIERFGAESGDILFFIADSVDRTHQALDHLRRKIARDRGLIPQDTYRFLWVTGFPLFAWDAHSGHLVTEHHPFTAPLEADLPLLNGGDDLYKVRSSSYDLVLNGYELGSGSQRIHDGALQRRIFELLKISPEEIENRFGFFVEALQYGTPPHLGIALGLDRLMMILCNTENIRDVIAFPKTQKAADVMMDAPSTVQAEQLHDLKIQIETPEFS